MTDLEKAVVEFFRANEAFADADYDDHEAASNRLVEAEDAILGFAAALIDAHTIG